MFIRYNVIGKYFEYDTTSLVVGARAGRGPWAILPLQGIGSVLPANVAYIDRNNNFQTVQSISGGVKFPVSSSDPQALDYYEEGNWVPTFTGDGGAPTGQVYSIRNGRYTRIGRQVIAHFDLGISNVGTGGAGNLYIIGLPFVNNAIISGSGIVTYFSALAGAVTSLYPYIGVNSTGALMYFKNAATPGLDGTLQYGNIAAGTGIFGVAIYSV